MRDASYLVTVPGILPEVPILERPPVVAYMPDLFTKPYPMVGDVVVNIEPIFETVVDLAAAHRSQVFEWLPFNRGVESEVPSEAPARRTWLRDWLAAWIRPRAERYRPELIATYGSELGLAISLIEVFEISEYAAPLDARTRQRLFWFLLDPAQHAG